jgi:hypothetical protein
MVSNEIRNCGIALGALMHQVTEEQAAMIRLIKQNLIAAADQAKEMESGLVVPLFKVNCDGDCKLCAAGPNTFKR